MSTITQSVPAVMTGRERILNILRGREVDRIPFTVMIVGDYWRTLPGWPGGRDMEAERERLRFMRNFYRQIGADMVTYNEPGFYRVTYDGKVTVERRTTGSAICTTIRTPLGDLTGRSESRDGYGYIMEPLIKNHGDCRVYAYFLDAQVIEADFDLPRMYLEEIGSAGIPYPDIPPPAPKRFLMHRTMEAEHLLTGLIDRNPDLMNLLEAWRRRNLQICEIAARSPLPVFQDGGATSTGLMSPDIYREFCLPEIQECCEILHRAGKLKVDHAVGEPIRGILDDIPESGVDGIMGFREETHGNATLEEVREAWRGRVCLIGGIDTDVLCRYDADRLAKHAGAFIRRIRTDDRMILTTSSAVMPGTSVENLETVRALADAHLEARR
jgi:hypothetical protein